MERTSQHQAAQRPKNNQDLLPPELSLQKNFSQQQVMGVNITELHTKQRAAVTLTYIEGSTELPQINKVGSMGAQPAYETIKANSDQVMDDISSNLPPGITLDRSQLYKNSLNTQTLNNERDSKIKESDSLKLKGNLVFVKDQNSKNEIAVHKNIYSHFGHEKSLDKVSKNQTIVYGAKSANKNIQTEDEIIEFLRLSKQFQYIENIQKIAEGGEAIIFKINYIGFDEVVIKVPLVKYQVQQGYSDLMHETHLIKCIYHEDYVVEIKEELIEIDEDSHQILRYCVVVERAQYSLYDLYSLKTSNSNSDQKVGLWFDDNFTKQKLDCFSIPKFIFYFFESLQALNYIHLQGVIFQDMKPQNLLVMRNQKIKFGDFGISLLIKDKNQKYKIKGISPDWCLPSIKSVFEKQKDIIWALQFDEQSLLRNDEYGLGLTFSTDLILEFSKNKEIDERYVPQVQFLNDLLVKLIIKNEITLEKAVILVIDYLRQNLDLITQYLDQLLVEKKFQGAYQIGKFLQKDVLNITDLSDAEKFPCLLDIYQMMGEFKYLEGDFLQALAHLNQAEKIYLANQSSTIISQEIKSNIDSIYLDVLIMTAKINININQYDEAFKKASLAQVLYQKDKQRFISKTLNLLDLQGQLALVQGKFNDAIYSFNQYVVVAKQMNSSDLIIRSRINSHKNMGILSYKMKHYDLALQNFQEALNLQTEENGFENPLNIDCMKNIGNVYLQKGEFEKANEIISKALKICQDIYGERNTYTAETYRQMGDILSRFNSAEAIQKYEKALKIFDSIYGQDTVHHIVIYNNMAGILVQQNQLQKGEEYCQKAFEISNKQFGSETLDAARIYENLCKIKIADKQPQEALEYSDKSYKLFSKLTSPIHADAIPSLMLNLALNAQLGEIKKSISTCDHLLNLSIQQNGEKHEITLKLTQLLSQLNMQAGHTNQGQRLLKQNLKNIDLQPGELQGRLKFDTLLQLGQSNEKLGKIDAIKYYKDALKYCPSPAYEFELNRCIAFFYCKNRQIDQGLEYLIIAEKILMENKDKDPLFLEFEKNFLKPILELKARIEKVLNFKKHNSHSMNV